MSGDFEAAGVLSLAISISGVFFTVSLFNVRHYQASNTDGSFSAGDYVFHRFFTCALSLILCCLFVAVNNYSIYTSLSIIGFMLLRIIEAFADVLHGEAQRKWRLDIAGKSNIIRGVLLIAVFSLSLGLWKNLALSIFLMAASNVIPLLLYDCMQVRKITDIRPNFDLKKLKLLFKICLPMLLYGICLNSIMPLSKYFLELFHGEAALGYFASVSTIAVLVQTLAALVFSPFVGMFGEAHADGDKKRILSIFVKLIAFLVFLTLLAFLATALLGELVLGFIFGEEIIPYVYLLYPTIISSALIATVTLLGMLLVVMRDSVTLLCGAACGFVVSLVLSATLIKDMMYTGTNIAVIVSLSVILIIYLAKFFVYIFRKPKTQCLSSTD